MGFFLLLISIVGLIGAIHHHQVMLFFVSFVRVGDPGMISWDVWTYIVIIYCIQSLLFL